MTTPLNDSRREGLEHLDSMFPNVHAQEIVTEWGFSTFYTCSVCGSIVKTDFLQTHYEYHQKRNEHVRTN